MCPGPDQDILTPEHQGFRKLPAPTRLERIVRMCAILRAFGKHNALAHTFRGLNELLRASAHTIQNAQLFNLPLPEESPGKLLPIAQEPVGVVEQIEKDLFLQPAQETVALVQGRNSPVEARA